MDADAVLPIAGVIFEPHICSASTSPRAKTSATTGPTISHSYQPRWTAAGLAPAQSSLATSTLWHVPVGQCCVDRLNPPLKTGRGPGIWTRGLTVPNC